MTPRRRAGLFAAALVGRRFVTSCSSAWWMGWECGRRNWRTTRSSSTCSPPTRTRIRRASSGRSLHSTCTALLEAIEEFEDALVRLEEGRYGTCQSCGASIPTERLEVIPQTRLCAACPSAADRGLRSPRRRGRREHSDGCSPAANRLAVAGTTVDAGVLAASRARHPSSLRLEPARDDAARW